MAHMILTLPHRLPLIAHSGVTLGAFALFLGAKDWLDASYAASGHPVDFVTGQLAFDAGRIEGYCHVMQEAGTLGVYLRTQIIDFGFIASVMLLAWLLGALIARAGGMARACGLAMAVLGVSGAAMDAVENLLSFVMLADPLSIAEPLALAYSAAAATKFGLLTAAMAAGLAGVLGMAIAAVPGLVRMRRA